MCIICKKCGCGSFTTVRLLGLHIAQSHKMTTQEYFDQYERNTGDGICRVCGKPTKFCSLSKGYYKHCSARCAGADLKTKLARQNTLLNKYGVTHISHIPESNAKKISTCLKRYGVENPSQVDAIKRKKEETTLLHYGVPYTLQSDALRAQIKETSLQKYGTENPAQSEIVKEKIRNTLLDKYGVEHALQSEAIKDKLRKTNLARFGVEYNTQRPEFNAIAMATCMKRYGETNPMKVPEIKRRLFKTKRGFVSPDGKHYDSRWEYLFELYLIEHNIPYAYQPDETFEWFDSSGCSHKYIPDFCILGTPVVYIEIKGEQFFDSNGVYRDPYNKSKVAQQNAKLKYECMIKNNVKILRAYDLIGMGIDLGKRYSR